MQGGRERRGVFLGDRRISTAWFSTMQPFSAPDISRVINIQLPLSGNGFWPCDSALVTLLENMRGIVEAVQAPYKWQ